MNSATILLYGNTPWHQQHPDSDTSHSVRAEMKHWEFQPANGTFCKAFGSPSNEVCVIIARGYRGWIYELAQNGFVQARPTSDFYATPSKAAEAAVLYLQQRGILPTPAPAPAPATD